ncbi:hypothetical protein D3C72_1794470 [compost metagenome]
MRRNQHGHQAKAPRPTQQIGQPTRLPRRARKALQVQRARQADERRRTHPVGRCRHAVVHGRNAPPRNVILLSVGRAAIHTDARIDHDGEEQEDGANPVARQALALGPGHEEQKAEDANHIQRQNAVQPPEVCAVARRFRRAGLSHGAKPLHRAVCLRRATGR